MKTRAETEQLNLAAPKEEQIQTSYSMFYFFIQRELLKETLRARSPFYFIYF